jgi:hypothetical protein
MKRLTLSLLVLTLLLPVVALACPFGEQTTVYDVKESPDQLVLSATVNGCQGKIKSHQDAIADEIEKAKAGASCESCPFGVKDLACELTRTDDGSVVVVKGPAEARAEFKKRLDARLAAAKDPAHTQGGCECAKAEKKFDAPAGCGCGGKLHGCGKEPGAELDDVLSGK